MSVQPFVGRESELAALRAAADEVVSTGVGRMVVLTGEAGAGKTRLSSELARVLTDGGVPVIWSRCWGDGGSPPLWPWPDVVAELARRARHRRSIPSLETGDRFQLFRTVVEQLRDICAVAPGVALIDDLHAAAGDAVLLTKFVARSLHRVPLLLVATWRLDATSHHGVPDWLEAIAPEATVIDVASFDERELATYVHLRLGRRPSPTEVAAMMAATGGNPLYVSELIREPSTSTRRSATRRLLQRRVTALSAEERRVLCAAAVLGDAATLSEVATVVGRPAADVQAVIDGAGSGARLVGGEVRFSHDLLRHALVASLSPARTQRLHASRRGGHPRIGRARQAVRRAHHCVEAASRSPVDHAAAVGACLEAVGRVAAIVGVRAGRGLGGHRVEARCGHGVAGHRGRVGARPRRRRPGVRAARRGTDVVREGHRTGRAGRRSPAVRHRRARVRWRVGRGTTRRADRRRMLGRCRQALAALGHDEPILAALLRVRLAAERAYDGGPGEAVVAAVDDVRRLGVPAATAEALSLYHHTLLAPAHQAMRLEVAEELLDVAAQSPGSIFSLFGLCWRTVDLYLAGDVRGERSFVELREQTTALASRSIGYIAAVLDVMRTVRRGELERAEELAADVLALGQEAGDADAFGYYGGHLLGIRWLQGRLGELGAVIDAVIDSATLRRRDRIYPAVRAYASCRRR